MWLSVCLCECDGANVCVCVCMHVSLYVQVIRVCLNFRNCTNNMFLDERQCDVCMMELLR